MSADDHDPPPLHPHDAASPPRLRSVGSGFERQLLASGELDAPVPEARERALAAARLALAAAQGQARQRRWRASFVAAAAGVLLALGAAGLWALSEPELAGVVPRAEPAPAPLPAQRPVTPLAELPACRKVMTAPGRDPLIDDFEDGNARLVLREGRAGAWLSTGDGTGKQIPPANTTAFPVRTSERGSRSTYALRLHVERLTGSGAGLYAELTPGHCYDASAYTGIEFWARGTGRIFFGPTQIDVMEKKWGGLCEEDCYDRHLAPADLTPEWKQYRFLWKDLEQAGWGRAVPFDPARILSVGFSVQAADTPAELWIDDVRFIQR